MGMFDAIQYRRYEMGAPDLLGTGLTGAGGDTLLLKGEGYFSRLQDTSDVVTGYHCCYHKSYKAKSCFPMQ